ncbi:MAG: hypothetical protein ABI763_15690 [Bacteroidota bacterium]
MKRILFLISFSLFTLAALAQVHDVSKASIAKPENRIVEMTATAIPDDQVENVAIDSLTYHKTVGVIDEDSKTIRMSAAAQRPSAGSTQTIKKEAIQSNEQGIDGTKLSGQKTVEVKVAATRR